jgi:hypothetical protein
MKRVYEQPIPTREERARQMLASGRDADRERWRDLVFTSARCLAWMLAGLALLGAAYHTSDAKLGMVFWWAGITVGNAGVLVTVFRAFRRGQGRGDW